MSPAEQEKEFRSGIEFLRDVSVGIGFTFPYYENVAFLDRLYPFHRKTYYGPISDSERGVKEVNLSDGRLLYRIFDSMFEESDVRGYLLLHDDYIVNFWNLVRFDKQKVWHQDFHRVELRNWSWWSSPYGERAYLAAQAELGEEFRLRQEEIRVGFSDIFYIPSRCVAAAREMFRAFGKHEVYLEIALPHVAVILGREAGAEKFRSEPHVWFNRRSLFWPRFYSHRNDGVHPVKLSRARNRWLVEKLRGAYMERTPTPSSKTSEPPR